MQSAARLGELVASTWLTCDHPLGVELATCSSTLSLELHARAELEDGYDPYLIGAVLPSYTPHLELS